MPKVKNMEEFASVSGISRPTLSKYFHDPGSVRASTRERIETALQRFDYRPNIYAMNQNRQLTKNVGIVVPYLADPFFAEIARIIEERVIEAGYRPVLYSSHGNPEFEADILESLRSLKPAGVLMAPLRHGPDRGHVERFCEDIPTVLFDSMRDNAGLAFIGSDSRQFARLIVEYLCKTGAPPCFFEMKTPANPNAKRRRAGYIEAMNALGYEPWIVQAEGEGWQFEEIGRREGLRALRAGAFATDTVLCSNDRLAIGFLAACYEKRLRVGRAPDSQIRVAGQDDHPFSRFTCPPLTTVAQDYDAISRTAVKLLFRSLEGETIARKNIQVEGKLVDRDSA